MQDFPCEIRSTQEPAFWIPVHLVDPERPTEHSIFNVPAGNTLTMLSFHLLRKAELVVGYGQIVCWRLLYVF